MNFYKAIVLVTSLCFLAACGDGKGSNNKGNGTATTPIDACIQTGTCTNSLYNNYTAYGWMAYPNSNSGYYQYYGNSSYYNYCACPSGYRPVYNASFGLGCYSENNFSAYSAYTAYFGYSSNSHWVNIPQVSNVSGYYNNSCFTNAAESCYVDSVNTCTVGKRCMPTAGGSRIGLCVH